MTYNPALVSIRDRIRFTVFDTTGDPATELKPDATYDAVIAMYPNWKRAAADMAEAIAVELDRKITGFTATGDMAVQWSDQAKTLRAKAIALRNEADTEEAGRKAGFFTINTVGVMDPGGEW